MLDAFNEDKLKQTDSIGSKINAITLAAENYLKKKDILDQLKTYHNQAIIWEITDHGKTGKVIYLSDNCFLIIENCDEPFAIVVENLTGNALLKNYEHPTVYLDHVYHPLFLKAGYDFHLRCELTLKNLVQSDFEFENTDIVKIDNNLQAEKYNLKENYLKYNYGYALIKNNIAVSEAYVTIGREWGELSIFTHPDYRKKGYAKLVLSQLIKDCNSQNIIPVYSCQVDNKASLYTGLSLGFTISRYYTLMVRNFGNILCPNLANWLRENKYP